MRRRPEPVSNMRFGVFENILLVAGIGDADMFHLTPGTTPGCRVK